MMVRHLGPFALLFVLLPVCLGASDCAAQRPKPQPPTPPTPMTPTTTPPPVATPAPPSSAPTRAGDNPVPDHAAFTELAKGNYADINAPFVYVARAPQAYEALRQLLPSLPAQPPTFFKAHVVIAAFLGQRRSGGYGIEFEQNARAQLTISERVPAKGAMVTMALTAPFRVVVVPIEPDDALALALEPAWQARARPYRITDGELTVIGGFAGIRESARLTGTLRVMRSGQLATFFFDVQSTSERRTRQLRDVASGSVAAAGQVALPRLDAFGVAGAIESPFRATGQFTAEEQQLSLSLETVPAPNVADNFGATGHLNATATAPAPAANSPGNKRPL